MSIHSNQTPRTITESSRNESNSVGHSHAIEKASVKQAGIVKLVDNLDSKSKTEALTANQGRELAERLSLLAQSSGSKEINHRLESALSYLATRYTAAYATYETAKDNLCKHPENSLIYVVNDPTKGNNGLWTVVGGKLVKAPWDTLSSALTSEPFEVLQSIFQGAAGEKIRYESKTYDTLATFTQTLAEGKTYIQDVLIDLARSNNFTASYLLTESGKFQEEVNQFRVSLRYFGAIEGGDNTAAFKAAFAAYPNKINLKVDVSGTITDTLYTPVDAVIDFSGTKYEFNADKDYAIINNNIGGSLHVIQPNITDVMNFTSRTKLHRAITGNRLRVLTLTKPNLTGFSTNIQALLCDFFYADVITLNETLGTLAQYGYGVNTSAKFTFIDSIFSTNASNEYGRHALYINGKPEHFYLNKLVVDGCYHNPVNVSTDQTDDLSGSVTINAIDIKNANKNPFTTRTSPVHFTAQGAGTYGNANIVVNIGQIIVDNCSGGAVSFGQGGYKNSTIGRIIQKNPVSSALTGSCIVSTRFVNNLKVKEIQADSLEANTNSYAVEFRDSTDCSVDSSTIEGSVGKAVFRLQDSSGINFGHIDADIPDVENTNSTYKLYDKVSDRFVLRSSATPDVKGIKNIYYTSANSITGFTNGFDGQEVLIFAEVDGVILKNSLALVNKSNADKTLALKETAKYIKRGSRWVEI